MKIVLSFKGLDEQIKKIGASEKKIILEENLDVYVSKLRSKDGLEITSLDKVDKDAEGFLTAFGERIVLYIRDTHNNADDIRKEPKGDYVVRYHIHGDCQKLKEMEADGRFNRYVIKSKPDGLFTVDGKENQIKNRFGKWVPNSGSSVTINDVKLGVCKFCLNKAGIHKDKSARKSREAFDIENFYKSLPSIIKPNKPKWTDKNFPSKDKAYNFTFKERSKRLKKEMGYSCSRCGVSLNESPHTRSLLHCHHKDGNNRNHEYDNLEILCISCHSDVGRNKLPGSIDQITDCKQIQKDQGISI
jgi:hypothetical protein